MKFTQSNKNRNVGQNYQSVMIMIVISLLMLGGIGGRLYYLQLIEGQKFKDLANNNRTRTIPKPPVRGNIFDRKGRILATSKLTHSVFILPVAVSKEQFPLMTQRLAKILELSPEEIQEPLEEAGLTSPTPVRIVRDITPKQITAIAEYSRELPGVQVEIDPVRVYPYGEIGAHILGYTGEVGPKTLAKRKDQGYRLGDTIGLMGIESALEQRLRGKWGGQQLEVDGSGKVVRILGQTEPTPGTDLHLTVDLDLQKAAERVLGGNRGAIVVLNPNNGSILAMASNPGFDPNIFSKRITPEIWRQLQSKDHPFVNRALSVFPPASTFKIVTTTAGIESGKFSSNTVLSTYPYLTIGGTRFGEWNKAGFGPLGFVGALKWSSDTFFYQIARGIGGPKLIEWTRKYGFGRKTGIELSEDVAGLVPDELWKRKQMRQLWTVGDTVNMSIGQGFLQATPLQVAVMFAVPANGGDLVKPHLLKDDEDSKKWRESLQISPVTMSIVKQGLRAVVNGGTGNKANSPGLPPVAGKTGTAEAPPRADHVWFGGFVPYDKPEIVVVAFGEHLGGGGGKIAAPMVARVMESYYQIKKQDKQQNKNKDKDKDSKLRGI